MRIAHRAFARHALCGALPDQSGRPIKGLIQGIQRHVQDPLADMLLRGEIPDGSTVAVDEGDGGLKFH